MRFLGRWAVRLVLIGIVLIVALVLLKDALLKAVAEHRLRAETGLEVRIGRFELGLARPQLTIENAKVFNAAEFGGSPLLEVPELHVEWDLAALRARRFRVKLLRLHVSELNIVESRDGRTNVAELMQRFHAPPAKDSAGSRSRAGFEFAGIDTLNLTVGRVKYLSLRNPNQSGEFEVGLKNEILTNVKSIDDVSARVLQAMLRRGISIQPGPQGWRLDLLSTVSSPAGTNASPGRPASVPRGAAPGPLKR